MVVPSSTPATAMRTSSLQDHTHAKTNTQRLPAIVTQGKKRKQSCISTFFQAASNRPPQTKDRENDEDDDDELGLVELALQIKAQSKAAAASAKHSRSKGMVPLQTIGAPRCRQRKTGTSAKRTASGKSVGTESSLTSSSTSTTAIASDGLGEYFGMVGPARQKVSRATTAKAAPRKAKAALRTAVPVDTKSSSSSTATTPMKRLDTESTSSTTAPNDHDLCIVATKEEATITTRTAVAATDENNDPNGTTRWRRQHETDVSRKEHAVEAVVPNCHCHDGGHSNCKNIVHALWHRTVHGPSPRTAEVARRRLARVVPWKPPPLSIHHGRHDRHPRSSSSSSAVSCLSFDGTGELLAVAYSRGGAGHTAMIAIYDWSTVVSADRVGRSLRQRRKGAARAPMPAVDPVLIFPVPSNVQAPVVLLDWNPYQPDELVVGLRSSGVVYVFDLEAVNGWLEKYKQDGVLPNSLLPPCRELRCFEEGARRLPGNNGGAYLSKDSSFCFLDDGNHAALAAGSSVYCWSLGGTNWVPGIVKLKWKFPYKNDITSMVVLTPDTLLLGSRSGLLALLDWQKLQRSSFSCKSIPTLVDSWLSYGKLEVPAQAHAMSIHHIRISVEQDVSGKPKVHRLLWVTHCGWVLSCVIESTPSPAKNASSTSRSRTFRRRKPCEIRYATKPIQCLNKQGETVAMPQQKWSIPTSQIGVDSIDSAYVWEKVEDNVVQTLPDHDNRVLVSGMQLVQQPSNPCLQWMPLGTDYECTNPSGTDSFRTVPLSKRAGRPSGVAVHPDEEWIAIGSCGHGVYLLNSRDKIA